MKKQCISEFLASYILALMELGMIVPLSVTQAIDLYQFCVLFRLLIAFVIILFNSISGAQFNHGVTISMVVTKRQSIDDRIVNKPGDKLFPFVIGAYILVLVIFSGSYTGMCLNAARDFGPRIAGLIFCIINGYDVSACFENGQFIFFLIVPTAGRLAEHYFTIKLYQSC